MSSEKKTLLSQHQLNTVSALERCKSFTFDVNQQAESLNQWEQRYNQHSKGIFSGYLDEMKLNGLHFFEEFTNQRLQQQCCVNDNNLWLGFSLQSQRPKINNTTISDGQLMIRPSGIEFELTTPIDFHIYGLVMNKDCLNDQMVGQDNDLWEDTRQSMQISMSNNYVCYELAKLISLLLNNSNSPTGSHEIFGEGNVDRLSRLTPLITSKVADLLAQTTFENEQVKVSQQTASRVITNINHYIKETKNYPLTISELCKISGVSRRTLQYCFEQGMGISPIQYIRDCRLNEIRRILLKEGDQINIADLALDFGFFHLGTFNVQYKELFAETPTQTIQRANNYLDIITKI
jgi:AraC family ethanolamine operon transcriptional activator